MSRSVEDKNLHLIKDVNMLTKIIFNKYDVTRSGDVIRIKTGRVLKPAKTGKYRNYLQVPITLNGISKSYPVHRLVALKYIPNVDNKPQVNHKDCDPSNNNVENLEWVTNSENIKHAIDNGRIPTHLPSIIVKCAQCKNDMVARQSMVKKGLDKFCNRACFTAYKSVHHNKGMFGYGR